MSNVTNSTVLNYVSRGVELESAKGAPAKTERKDSEISTAIVKPQARVSDINPEQALEQALDVINRAMVLEQRSLSFSVDEVSGRSIIKVVDQQTEQLIRQIPTEEVLRVAQDIKKLQEEMGQSLGLLIDRKI